MKQVEINMAVAKAAGIEAVVVRAPIGSGRVCLRSENYARWNPAGDWNDAMEAADKTGLFDPGRGCAELSQVKSVEGTEWCVELDAGYAGPWAIISDPTGPTAICEAILAMKGNNDAA